MPASLPVIPGGSLIEKRVNSCSESALKRRRLKGLYLPATLLRVPAIRPGLKGGRPPVGQGPLSGPGMIWKAEVGVIGAAPEEGVSPAFTSWVRQAAGVAKGERVPSLKCRVKEE